MNDFLLWIRHYRIGPFAMFDTFGTYIIVYLIAPRLSAVFAKIGITITRGEWMALALPIALVFHLIFNVDTPFTRMFLDPNNYLAKILIIAMVLFGLKGVVKRIM